MSQIGLLARKLARTPFETERIDDPRAAKARLALFVAIGTVLALLVIPVLVTQMVPWGSFKPALALERGDWHVLERDLGPCGETAAGTCAAAPANPALWQSPRTRADADHVQRIRQRMGHDFWIGATIPPEQLARARALQANRLILGRINATYRIWIDGLFVSGGKGRSEAEPVLLTIPMPRLGEKRPLRVALHLYHDVEHKAPDLLAGNTQGEGFTTRAGADTYRSLMSFWSTSRPFAFAIAYATLCLIFFYLWRISPAEQEYFYMSLHLLVSVFVQLRLADTLDVARNTPLHFALAFVLEAYKAAFGMFLGLAFARTRRAFFAWGLPLCLAVPPVLLLAFPAAHDRHDLFNFTRRYVVELMYFFGAAACLIQAVHLKATTAAGTYVPMRIQRLRAFAAGLFFQGAVYGVWVHGFGDVPFVTTGALWTGYEHFLLVIFLGAIAVRDFRQSSLLVQRTPISEYHGQKPLPERLSGLLLVADLKSSEAFYRHRAEHPEAANLVGVWRSHVYIRVAKLGGVVIHKKGDEVAVFFDRARVADPAGNALRAVQEIAEASALLARELGAQGLLPAGTPGFFFRAAVANADLKPVWEELGASREPGWVEVSPSAPLEHVARLFAVERALKQPATTTLAVFPTELARQAMASRPELAHLALDVTDSSHVVFAPQAKAEATAREVLAA